MQELAQATFTYEQFPEVMSMLWKRMLQENKRNWRRTYKVRDRFFFFLQFLASHPMRNNKLYYTEDIESSIVIVL